MKRTCILLLALGIGLSSAGAPEGARTLSAETTASPVYEAAQEPTTTTRDFRGAGFWRDLLACGGCILGTTVATIVSVVGGIIAGSACTIVCLS